MTARRLAVVVAAGVCLAMLITSACKKKEEGLTGAEAAEALEEATLSTQASALTSSTIEISTSFQIGDAVAKAAEDLKTFIETQLPCAEITLAAGTLSVEYGAKPGSCVYKGQTYKGTHTVTIEKNEAAEVVVKHTWDQMENQLVSVTGNATVTWSLANKTRNVQHSLTWTRKSDGRTGTGSGNRTQSVLEGGLLEGIQIDGTRAWDGQSGRWDLAIEAVQVRWIDPVPQSGAYQLTAPSGKFLRLSFARVDEDTIGVTVTSGGNAFTFNVTKLGAISES